MSARARTRAAAVPSAELTDRIEEVATRLFILHGYNGVSYLDIARELSVTHSNIHYYFRTKAILAEAVLRRVAEATLGAMKAIWADPDSTLHAKFVATRDWMHVQFLRFNPGGKGGRPWGLLSRFALEADALNNTMRRQLRASLDRLEDHIRTGIGLAVRNGELVADAPVDGITLQLVSLMAVTGQMTRQASGFGRLDELLYWTCTSLERAYGARPAPDRAWPAPVVPAADTAPPT